MPGSEVVEREQFLQVVGDLGRGLGELRPVRVLERLGCNPANSRSACSGSAGGGSRGLSSPAVQGALVPPAAGLVLLPHLAGPMSRAVSLGEGGADPVAFDGVRQRFLH